MKNMLEVFCLVVNRPIILRYRSTCFTDDRITFIVVGDWGAEFLSEQDTVAAAMDRFSGEYGAQFVISTGDNFYQWGVDSINDEQFDEKWRWVYNTTNLVVRYNKPCSKKENSSSNSLSWRNSGSSQNILFCRICPGI